MIIEQIKARLESTLGKVVAILVAILLVALFAWLIWFAFFKLRLEVAEVDGIEFVRIPGEKTYLAGSPDEEFGRYSQGEESGRIETRTEKTIDKTFWMSTREISNADYARVMGVPVPGDPELPVTQVSWNDAKLFSKRFGERAAGDERFALVRLPTEWEWEYAARGGWDGPYGAWKNRDFRKAMKRLKQGDSNQLIRYGRRYLAFKDGERTGPSPVGSFKPNRFGLYDMNGNVWEWCESDGDFTSRPLRGGGWQSAPELCRNAYRNRESPSRKTETIGFRIVLVEP